MNDSKKITPLRGEKVMIVDDCRIMRDYLRQMLLEMGFSRFVEADCADETLSKYASEQPDLVFLDIMLDEEDGLQVFEQLLAKDAKAQVAIISAHSTADNVKKAMLLGAKGFLVKPFQPKKLFVTLKNMGCKFVG
ncbi:chemotaxis protein [Catenovulum agarivorans DS-2]|uniref:Chemotaxis protein n=1 Tax=Catenovulum agarivorans DS-2 TaxID=1328313 RepID=W7R077_9ALTE|nr:response regulator [Catenovulum agarivorans]EWH11020.1 chemotaxis protein [Catenovulum agarivorans DS-2]